MKYTTVVRHAISAAHSLKGHPTCERVHGHEYMVRVHVEGESNPAWHSMTVPPEKIEAIRDVISELNFRDLNAMMGGSVPSVQGIANYLMARLALLGATKVEVDESGTGLSAATEATAY